MRETGAERRARRRGAFFVAIQHRQARGESVDPDKDAIRYGVLICGSPMSEIPNQYNALMDARGRRLVARLDYIIAHSDKTIYANLTPSEKAALREKAGSCELCGSPENLVVDHNHANGKVRGILCSKCNAAIGMLCDDPEIIRRAANYVEQDGTLKE